MHLNPEKFITHIYFLVHVVAEKLLALALWRAHLIAKKAQHQIHVVNANHVKI
jgi:hypothetical protein